MWMIKGKRSSTPGFQGGTSLSKVYGLIDRFSEDIDLSIEKDFFGFASPNNPESAPSKKKQNRIIENLSQASADYAHSHMLTDQAHAIHAKLGTKKGWQLLLDLDDPDSKTLLFLFSSSHHFLEQLLEAFHKQMLVQD